MTSEVGVTSADGSRLSSVWLRPPGQHSSRLGGARPVIRGRERGRAQRWGRWTGIVHHRAPRRELDGASVAGTEGAVSGAGRWTGIVHRRGPARGDLDGASVSGRRCCRRCRTVDRHSPSLRRLRRPRWCSSPSAGPAAGGRECASESGLQTSMPSIKSSAARPDLQSRAAARSNHVSRCDATRNGTLGIRQTPP